MVVHIITRLAMGGAQQQAFEIVKRMHQSGKDVIIFTGLSDMKKSLSAKDNKILNLIKNDNIPVEIIPTLNDRISLLNDFKSLIRIYFLIIKITYSENTLTWVTPLLYISIVLKPEFWED